MKLKLNVDILGLKKGHVVDTDAITDTRLIKFWNDRLKDSRIDNCVELVESKKVAEKAVKIKKETKKGK